MCHHHVGLRKGTSPAVVAQGSTNVHSRRLSKQRMLRSSLQVWHAAVALRKEAVRIVDSSTAKREARHVSSCFESWQQRLAGGLVFRSQLQQMGRACDLLLQRQAFSSWRDHLAVHRQHKVSKSSTASFAGQAPKLACVLEMCAFSAGAAHLDRRSPIWFISTGLVCVPV